MSGFRNRLEKLERERAETVRPRRWHRIIQALGQTQSQAIAAHEAEHGRIAADDCTIIRRIIAPAGEAI